MSDSTTFREYVIGALFKQLLLALGQRLRHHTFGASRPTAPSTGNAATVARNSGKSPPKLSNIDLDRQYTRSVQWPSRRIDVPDDELAANELFKLWDKIPGGHKWTHYFGVYEEVFGPRRHRPLRILEIGVAQGASLKLWRQYFTHADTVIVGIDITPVCAEFAAPATGVHVRIGSQADAVFLKTVVDEFGPFDIIIDDGSHRSSHIITSFNHLFGYALKDTGIYFAEDLHASYWPEWRDSKKIFFDVCRTLMDHMHAHYSRLPPRDFFVIRASDQSFATLDVPLITTMIKEIRIFDSMAAIYKSPTGHVPYYLRSEDAPPAFTPAPSANPRDPPASPAAAA